MASGLLNSELQELLDRWVHAIESKDIVALAEVFRQNDDLSVCWSNGERSHGWDAVRRHIEKDFRQEVDLFMKLHDVETTSLGNDGAVLSYRYDITLRDGRESVTCSRHASMSVHRDPEGWRVASLHVSTPPAPETASA